MNDDLPAESPTETTEKAEERDIAALILTTSSVMLGLCLTIISIMRSSAGFDGVASMVDDIVAVDALIFLLACFASYAALRARHLRRMKHLESFADTVFLVGMVGIGTACALFVWTIL
jgi:hypothetical protein